MPGLMVLADDDCGTRQSQSDNCDKKLAKVHVSRCPTEKMIPNRQSKSKLSEIAVCGIHARFCHLGEAQQITRFSIALARVISAPLPKTNYNKRFRLIRWASLRLRP
jgi:hypothetical protein